MAKKKTAKLKERPYNPSLIDRFSNWVGKRPISEWVFYAAFGLVLIVIQVLFLWLDGGLVVDELLPVLIFNGLATPFLLALMHFLDKQAVTAFGSMKPALKMTRPEFKQYEYMLSNMPAGPSLIAGLTMLVMAILTERLAGTPVRYAALEQLPNFPIVFQIIDKSSAFLFGAFFYHTVRQLGLINAINMKHIRISLFNLGPLQAFSRLTASTAVALVIFVYVWMLINPELLRDPIIIGYTGVITILAAAVFVWPLYGVHRLMKTEKERMLHALDLRFETAFAKFNKAFGDEDRSAIEKLNGMIASLDMQHRRITAIPTWPWRSETAQFALTAIALPLILTIVRFFVEQALDW